MNKASALIITLILLISMGMAKVGAVTNLDLSGDFYWPTPTASELRNGYTIRRGAVTFVVDSDTDWQVTVKADPDENYSEGTPP